jgi:hypothetical protein
VRLNLVLLAGCASFDVVGDPLFHPYPIVELLDFPDGFVSSWVPGGWMIVV